MAPLLCDEVILVASCRLLNIIACIEYLRGLAYSQSRFIVLTDFPSVDTSIISEKCLVTEIYDSNKVSIREIVNSCTILVFADNAFSFPCFLLANYVLKNQAASQKVLIRCLSLPSPSDKKRLYHYLFNGVGTSDFVGCLARLLFVIRLSLRRIAFDFLSYPSDKTVYLCPPYNVIKFASQVKLLPSPNKSPFLNTSPVALFMDGNESEGILLCSAIVRCLSLIGSHLPLLIKPHPARLELKPLHQLVNQINSAQIVNSDSDHDPNAEIPLLIVTISSSSLFSNPCVYGLSLAKLVPSTSYGHTANRVSPVSYNLAMYKFFSNPSHISFPDSLTALGCQVRQIVGC